MGASQGPLLKGLELFADAAALDDAAARSFLLSAQKALQRGRFSVALSGGHSPLGMFERLAARSGEINWGKVDFYWVDERWVPTSDPQSNYGSARRLLLDRLPLAASRVHPWDTTLPSPEAAAKAYEELLKAEFGAEAPRFDLCLLGMGQDGHTASLFPSSPALQEDHSLCLAVRHPDTLEPRLTLSLGAINASESVVFLIQGPEKAPLLKSILARERASRDLPAARVRCRAGAPVWMAAGSEFRP